MQSAKELLDAADQKLYTSKESGRNRTTLAPVRARALLLPAGGKLQPVAGAPRWASAPKRRSTMKKLALFVGTSGGRFFLFVTSSHLGMLTLSPDAEPR